MIQHDNRILPNSHKKHQNIHNLKKISKKIRTIPHTKPNTLTGMVSSNRHIHGNTILLQENQIHIQKLTQKLHRKHTLHQKRRPNKMLTQYYEKYGTNIPNLYKKQCKQYDEYIRKENIPRQEWYDNVTPFVNTLPLSKTTKNNYKRAIRYYIETIAWNEKW